MIYYYIIIIRLFVVSLINNVFTTTVYNNVGVWNECVWMWQEFFLMKPHSLTTGHRPNIISTVLHCWLIHENLQWHYNIDTKLSVNHFIGEGKGMGEGNLLEIKKKLINEWLKWL